MPPCPTLNPTNDIELHMYFNHIKILLYIVPLIDFKKNDKSVAPAMLIPKRLVGIDEGSLQSGDIKI